MSNITVMKHIGSSKAVEFGRGSSVLLTSYGVPVAGIIVDDSNRLITRVSAFQTDTVHSGTTTKHIAAFFQRHADKVGHKTHKEIRKIDDSEMEAKIAGFRLI